jgi:hypothetical protein
MTDLQLKVSSRSASAYTRTTAGAPAAIGRGGRI